MSLGALRTAAFKGICKRSILDFTAKEIKSASVGNMRLAIHYINTNRPVFDRLMNQETGVHPIHLLIVRPYSEQNNLFGQ